jgi:hypothetical protein
MGSFDLPGTCLESIVIQLPCSSIAWQFQLTETVSLPVQFGSLLCTPGLGSLDCLGLKIGDDCSTTGPVGNEGHCALDEINETVCQQTWVQTMEKYLWLMIIYCCRPGQVDLYIVGGQRILFLPKGELEVGVSKLSHLII